MPPRPLSKQSPREIRLSPGTDLDTETAIRKSPTCTHATMGLPRFAITAKNLRYVTDIKCRAHYIESWIATFTVDTHATLEGAR